jgi:D-beta-D-heptose 7-phosphate kinase/D-beta-D-heptose 1-phosphate adenosyltransferase
MRPANARILSIQAALAWRAALRRAGAILALTNGCFDLVHSAHIRLLQFAKRQGDILVVAINSDESVRRLKGASRPIQGIDERCRLMQSLEIVDYVVVFDGDTPLDVIRDLRPDVLVKGGDYAVDQIVGREYAGSVVLYDYQAGLSSSNTIRRVLKQNTLSYLNR